MSGLLIVAHAPLASAFKQVAAHVYPEAAPRVFALDVPADWTQEHIGQAIAEAVSAAAESQVLVLADVAGASPCNVATRLADGVTLRVVAGLNVPMLWRTLCYLDESVDALVARAVAGGTQGVMQLTATKPQNQPLHSLPHDQKLAHHQQ